ncbi:MAG: immune inhibitor A [Caldilineaceae bacterium]|nr:immune inhibitor A [Caldilineaceae bacterium]
MVVEQFDLSAYAGEQVQVRFEYVTDDAVTKSGWFIDDIAIPAIDYATDFEQGADGWESEGWLLTDNRLPNAGCRNLRRSSVTDWSTSNASRSTPTAAP